MGHLLTIMCLKSFPTILSSLILKNCSFCNPSVLLKMNRLQLGKGLVTVRQFNSYVPC